MTINLYYIIFVIFLAYAFDFINGFHDAANSIATIVATGLLKPFWAVVWAAFFNFMAFFIFKLAVAHTVGVGLIQPGIVDTDLIFSALIGAISWNLITWYFGMPSSSSHALIGGLVGAALARGGMTVIIFSGLNKVLLAIVLSPIIGALLGFLINLCAMRISKHWSEEKKQKRFRYTQYISAAFLSITHGGNDAQKTMGVIAVLLFSSGLLNGRFYVPFWVVISCYLVIALGTLVGGWRIVKTMGEKITQLNNMRGCSAESGSAITICFATILGIPISTTHTVTGAITGVGFSFDEKKVNWHIIRQIIFVWITTIPAAGGIAALLVYLHNIF